MLDTPLASRKNSGGDAFSKVYPQLSLSAEHESGKGYMPIPIPTSISIASPLIPANAILPVKSVSVKKVIPCCDVIEDKLPKSKSLGGSYGFFMSLLIIFGSVKVMEKG